MNSFSLRPRLLILVHKGRQLLLALQQQSCARPLFYRANSPVRLPVQKQTVRSQAPLTLPRQSGICARVSIALEQWQIEPGMAYALPDIALQFTPPDTVEPIALRLSAGGFKTFLQGQPFKQLLEYWATLLHCELAPLGWKAYRQGTSLCIEAAPERAGWNLQGSFVSALSEPLHAKATQVLPPPPPFDSRKQQAGQALVLTWGPYRLGDARYGCRLVYDPTWRLADLQQAFQEALHLQGFFHDIQWPEDYLQIGFPAHLTLQKETASAADGSTLPFLALDLNPVQQRQHSISFVCNGERCQLEAHFDTESAMLQVLKQQLASTALDIGIDDAGHLYFQAKDRQTPLSLSELTDSACSALGLSEMREPAPDLAYNERVGEWQDWLALARQYVPLLQSETDLQQTMEPFLSTFGERDDTDLYNEAWQGSFQQVLDTLDAWMLASESQASLPLWGVGLVNQSLPSPQAGATRHSDASHPEARSDKNVATSNFDHKI